MIQQLPDFNDRLIETQNLDTRLGHYLAEGLGRSRRPSSSPTTSTPSIQVSARSPTARSGRKAIIDAIGQSAGLGALRDHPHLGRLRRLLRSRRSAPGRRLRSRIPRAVHHHQPVREEGRRPARAAGSTAPSPKFCEKIFGLPAMTARDGSASLDDLMSAFDFTQAPRPYSEFVQ